jgi:hypothetical protein
LARSFNQLFKLVMEFTHLQDETDKEAFEAAWGSLFLQESLTTAFLRDGHDCVRSEVDWGRLGYNLLCPCCTEAHWSGYGGVYTATVLGGIPLQLGPHEERLDFVTGAEI